MDKSDPSGAEYWRRRALGLPEPKEYKAYVIPVQQAVDDALTILAKQLRKVRKKRLDK